MLRELRSLKLKLVIVILVAINVTAAVTAAAAAVGLPTLAGAALGILLSLAAAQLLAGGTTSPLREMAAVASALAAGEQVREAQVSIADEIGELAVAFNRMTAQVAETDRLRREVVANVSHELRTPLGALQATLENVVERVFERFIRGDGAPRGGAGGAGLGLAIARWIVELHGGEIRAERREPAGTRFVVTLPQAV